MSDDFNETIKYNANKTKLNLLIGHILDLKRYRHLSICVHLMNLASVWLLRAPINPLPFLSVWGVQPLGDTLSPA